MLESILEFCPPMPGKLGAFVARNDKLVPSVPEVLLQSIGQGISIQACSAKQGVFSQGDPAASLFYIHKGRVKLTVFSSQGKAATIAILGEGDFLGEECLAPAEPLRLASAVAVTECSLIQIEKDGMLRALDCNRALAGFFMEYLLVRKTRVQKDLADQLSNSSEKRLARVLLLLVGPGNHGPSNDGHPEISHETLAEMVGTTRPRISYFMNKFRKMGLIDYSSGLHVRKGLEQMLE